jgi:CP family cyanate transporter-like MFS transporter
VPPPRSHERLVLAALLLGGLVLRPQLVGIGPLSGDIQRDLGLSHTAAGLLATIPVLCMGLLAPLGPIVAARFGTVATVTACIGLIGIAGVVRAFADDQWTMLALTVGIGVGMGAGGVLLPVVVREHLPDRALDGTVAYSSGIQAGAAASAVAAIPLAAMLGGWRGALIALSVLSLVIVVPWSAAFRRATRVTGTLRRTSIRDFLDRTGWWFALLFGLFGVAYYGLIAWLADAYVEFGWAPVEAGGLVGLLNAGALVGALTIRFIVPRIGGQNVAIVLIGAIFTGAIAGLALSPGLGLVWAALAGYANGSLFPLLLNLPVRSSTSTQQVAGRSTLMIGAGYTLAASSPVALGAVRDASGSFHASLMILVGIGVVLLVGLSVTMLSVRSWMAEVGSHRA